MAGDLSNVMVKSEAFLQEVSTLPALGESPPLPGEPDAEGRLACGARRTAARARLLCLYGAADTAAAFADWQARAPPWLEVRAVELPGHGSREADQVCSLGRRQVDSNQT